jgi:hypothetical protein
MTVLRFIGLGESRLLWFWHATSADNSIIPGHNGLGVIGGNTVNFVGLGGCLPESSSSFSESCLATRVDYCV